MQPGDTTMVCTNVISENIVAVAMVGKEINRLSIKDMYTFVELFDDKTVPKGMKYRVLDDINKSYFFKTGTDEITIANGRNWEYLKNSILDSMAEDEYKSYEKFRQTWQLQDSND
jgi:hypothetical protein